MKCCKYSLPALIIPVLFSCGNTPDSKFFPDMTDSPAVETQESDPLSHADWNKRSKGYHLHPGGTMPRNFVKYPFPGKKEEQKDAGKFLINPFPMSPDILERGEKLYQTYCEPCHGPRGNGKRNAAFFPAARNLTDTAVKDFNDGEIFHIISRGSILMNGLETVIEPEDRWMIVNYVRLLQAMNE